jgi:hypothetical protein
MQQLQSMFLAEVDDEQAPKNMLQPSNEMCLE